MVAKEAPKVQETPKALPAPLSKLEQIQADYEAMMKRAEARRLAKEERARVLGLFEAVASGDKGKVSALL